MRILGCVLLSGSSASVGVCECCFNFWFFCSFLRLYFLVSYPQSLALSLVLVFRIISSVTRIILQYVWTSCYEPWIHSIENGYVWTGRIFKMSDYVLIILLSVSLLCSFSLMHFNNICIHEDHLAWRRRNVINQINKLKIYVTPTSIQEINKRHSANEFLKNRGKKCTQKTKKKHEPEWKQGKEGPERYRVLGWGWSKARNGKLFGQT